MIRRGTAAIRPELEELFHRASAQASPDERRYLPLIGERIREGSLAELMTVRFRKDGSILPVLTNMADCLRDNLPYRNP